MAQKNVLITGAPGVGKTTLIKKIIAACADLSTAGFYTQELREKGVRVGFELIGLDGNRSLLSHVRIRATGRIGKYGVDVPAFERFLSGQAFPVPEVDLVLIDEIGKMECYSEKFQILITSLLNSVKPVVATIARKGGGFISGIKERRDTALIELTQKNRGLLTAELPTLLRSFAQGAKKINSA